MWRQLLDDVRTPHPKRHRGQYAFERIGIIGDEEAERPPFTGLQWRTPQPRKMALRHQFA
jgi:hypothetical protein